jgi:hypothetical protein
MGRQAYDSVSRVMNEAMGGIIGFLDERAE